MKRWWSELGRRWRVALLGVTVVLLVLVAGGAWAYLQVNPLGSPGDPVSVSIPEGSSSARIGTILADEGVVGSARVFRLYVRVTGASGFQAGDYRRGEFQRHMSMGAVVDVLQAGPRLQYSKLTIPEGFTLRQIAARVGKLPGLRADTFLAVANSGRIRSRYEPQGVDSLEGLLFPDTYRITESETEADILRRMVHQFEAVADETAFDAASKADGFTPYQEVIIASLVEAEAKVPEDRPLISAVIHNRLAKGMLLQVDATVLYALGEHKDRVLDSDLKVASPYNTYLHGGLPPTPIAAPGRASLEAAVHPAKVDYLYYVKFQANGKHAFASTEEEFRRLDRERRARGIR